MNKIQRRQEWRSALRAWANSRVGARFEWGNSDCASLARQALLIMFGDELAVKLPVLDQREDAVLALQEYQSVGAILESLGAERTSVGFMRAGDIVVFHEETETVGHVALMVCIDGRQCLYSSRGGVAFTTLDRTAEAAVYSLWEVVLDG